MCVLGRGGGTESGDPLITDSQSSDLVYLDIAISFLSCIYDKAGNVQFELKMRVIIKHR